MGNRMIGLRGIETRVHSTTQMISVEGSQDPGSQGMVPLVPGKLLCHLRIVLNLRIPLSNRT